MHKNPFVPPPSYTQPQPPLPPGPPPVQPDYSAYWNAAGGQPPPPPPGGTQPPGNFGSYNAQWTSATQPPTQTPQQSAMYANYGYGGQQQQWQQQQQHQQHQQQQQQQQQQHRPPPPAYAQPPAPPAPVQQTYNPYQPQMVPGPYQGPFVPPAVPTPPRPQIQQQYIPQAQPMAPQAQPMQQTYFPHGGPPHQPPPPRAQPMNANPAHHPSPQHLPPAKRPRIDRPMNGGGPGNNNNNNNNRGGPGIPQPQFQAPPPPTATPMAAPMQQNGPGGGGGGPSGGPGRGGASGLPVGPARGGSMGGRGGPPRGGKSFQSSGRGGGSMGGGGGRGGRTGGMGGPGGAGGGGGGGGGRSGGGQGGGSLKAHGSRGGFNGRRGGGSFSAGHQGGMAGNRGRGGGPFGFRGSRRDNQANSIPLGPSASFNTSNGPKKEGAFSDFKIVGLEIPDLGWTWGTLPAPVVDVKQEGEPSDDVSETNEKDDKEAPGVGDEEPEKPAADAESSTSPVKVERSEADLPEKPVAASSSLPARGSSPPKHENADEDSLRPPPSRIRIYFHTPVSADDAHAQHLPSGGASPEHPRRGKRKHGVDDDDEPEEDRAPRRPRAAEPQAEEEETQPASHSVDEGRASVAPSVDMASSAVDAMSEADWLMGTIGHGTTEEQDAGGENTAADAAETEEVSFEDPPSNELVDNTESSAVRLEPGEDVESKGHATVEKVAADGTPAPEPVSPPEPTPQPPAAPSAEASAPAPEVVDSRASVESDVIPGLREVDDGNVPGLNYTGPEAGGAVAGETDMVGQSKIAANEAAVIEPAKASTSAGLPDAEAAAPSMTAPVGDDADSDKPESASDADPKPTQIAGEPDVSRKGAAPLKAEGSFASTVADDDVRDSEDVAQLIEAGRGSSPEASRPDAADESQAAPDLSDTLVESSNASMAAFDGDISFASVSVSTKPDVKNTIASANRFSISYAGGRRRLVVDAEVVEKLKVFRAEGRIEIQMTVEKADAGDFRGILLEGLADDNKTYTPIGSGSADGSDTTLPPFSSATLPLKTKVLVYLDTERRLSEPKWVRSGDVQEWLKSLFGRMFWVAGDAADGWERRIEVADPDPPPTIWTVLDGWATAQPSSQVERQRFVKTHMSEPENVLEILLRLVRGERATPISHSGPAIASGNPSNPLFAALTPESAHGGQQNHVSLAVLAMFKMTLDYAKMAGGDKLKAEAEERIGELIRCLPSHLIHKSLDGIYHEWRAEKKGGR